MCDSSAHGGQMSVTADGWIVADTDLRQFRLLMGHPPPRPYGYVDQRRADVRDWRCVLLWLLGVGLIAVAAATKTWLIALPGTWLLIGMFLLLRGTVGLCRDRLLRVGIVEALGGRHPLLRELSMAKARLSDGEDVSVALPTRVAAAAIEERGAAEVVMLYSPQEAYCLVIGTRAASQTS